MILSLSSYIILQMLLFLKMFHYLQGLLSQALMRRLFLPPQTGFAALFLCLIPLGTSISCIGCPSSLQSLHSLRSAFGSSAKLFLGIQYFSFTFSSYFCFTPLSLSYSYPLDRFGFSSTTTLLAKYMSYQGFSALYQSFIGQVASILIPRSVSEALKNPQ